MTCECERDYGRACTGMCTQEIVPAVLEGVCPRCKGRLEPQTDGTGWCHPCQAGFGATDHGNGTGTVTYVIGVDATGWRLPTEMGVALQSRCAVDPGATGDSSRRPVTAAAVLCLCHGRHVEDCPSLGYRPVRMIERPTKLDHRLAPHEGMCGLCGAPYACGQRVVEMPPPTWGRPFAHAECPRS